MALSTLELLMALNGNNPNLPDIPQPARPVVGTGPLTPPATPQYQFNPEPALPPGAPMQAPNTNFINQYAGQAPTPPAPLSRGQRIANALIGFGAGVQGNGPQFLESLRAPERAYERQNEQYQDRRTRALELDERRRERQQELTQRRAEAQNDRDFQVWVKNSGVTDSMALEQLRQSHELEKEARRQRFETERELEREQRRREDDARSIAGRLGGPGAGAAPPHIAKELGEFYANVRQSVSPAAAKWVNAQARRAEILARPAVGGGAAASRRELQDLQRRTSQAVVGIAGMEKLARQAMETTEDKRAPILNQMRSMAGTLQAQFPELLEVGEHNGWPFARLRLRGSQAPRQQQPQQPQGPSDAEVQAYAQQFKVSPEKARQELLEMRR